ncbi:MAG: dienelactone hydrolase family protein [Gammaproteobacteria bacterium]|nr:dienelactone hydrolase family protein [Gammaproteobacteria bacterium]
MAGAGRGLEFLMLAAVLAVAPAQAQGVRIHMHADEGTAADGMLFQPAGAAPFPAVVLIPDKKGLTPEVSDTGEALARAGFFTVVLDLSHGEPPGHDVPAASVRHDLDAALAFLAKQTTLRPNDTGALGFGTGADYALELAAARKLRAAALENPTLPADATHTATVRVPVLADVALGDGCSKPAAAHAFRGALHHLGRQADVKVWPEVCDFANLADAAHYRAPAAAELRERQVAFFRRTLARADSSARAPR